MHPAHHVVPQPARLTAVEVESDDTRTFTFTLEPSHPAFDAARPGQFVMLSLLGVGEAAFTPSRVPYAGGPPGHVVLTVRRVGRLTSALFALAVGARAGLRGPLGRGFPEGGEDLATLYVAGGCGLAPLRAAVDAQLRHRSNGAAVTVLYGARDPDARIHRAALAAWSGTPGVRVLESVDHPTPAWHGLTGPLGDHLDEALRPLPARAAVCGPPAMLGPVAHRLRRAGLPADRILVAVERHMQCGTGECGHCYLGPHYVCRDGPVFTLADLLTIPDAFGHPADTWASSCG